MLLNVIGASALALSAPPAARAQEAGSAPGAAAVQNTPAAGFGASIRKLPGAAAAGGAPAADSAAAVSAASAAPGATESVAAPAVMVTPAAHAKTKAARSARSDGAAAASAKSDSTKTNASSKERKDSKGQESPFSSLQFSGNKGPINIKSDTLNLDYKANVVTFSGHVNAVQADAILTSETLTVNYLKDFHQVTDMVADGNVRISQGTRFATGDHGVFDQAKHTVTLTGNPVVHDGEDQVSGTRITCHLDTGKCDVEGARAVFFPKEQKTRDNKKAAANPS